MSEYKRGQGGEFRGDFTRDTFDPAKNFTRVLMQQGRVQLDADWNEQVSILYHYMRQLGEDLMGPHAVPVDENGNPGNGFEITVVSEQSFEFYIDSGNYYVQGIRCSNDTKIKFDEQLNYTLTEEDKELIKEKKEGNYLVYLDVWERHLTSVEDDDIREKALGGTDTATRAKIVWQVRMMNDNNLIFNINGANNRLGDITKSDKLPYSAFLKALEGVQETKPGAGKLRARAKQVSDEDKDPCLTAPEASYRGAENQLYRVEIHNSGSAKTNGAGEDSCATFKWSRENGAVIFPIIGYQDGGDENIILELEHLGRDDRFSLKVDDWVEVVNKDVMLQNQANPLLQATQVDREKNQVFLRLSNKQQQTINGLLLKPSYLRRWDQKNNEEGGRGLLTVSEQADNWIPLENGIEIQFKKEWQHYQTGDYWLIPARTATGDVEWPSDPDGPQVLPADGVKHYYAPLAIINVNGTKVSRTTDLRRKLQTNLAPSP
jgi:hypothetical protein